MNEWKRIEEFKSETLFRMIKQYESDGWTVVSISINDTIYMAFLKKPIQ